jgi:hypothetical protein
VGLAFLEAQTWHEAFGAIRHAPGGTAFGEGGPEHPDTPARAPAERTVQRPRRALCPKALAAAALLVAFALGWSARVEWDGPHDASRTARSQEPRHETPGADFVGQPEPSGNESEPATRADARRQPASHLVGVLSLPCGGGPKGRGIRVPVFRATSLNQELKRRPPEISDYVRSQWERRGYRVSESPRLVPLHSRDGRLVLLPVNHVTLAPVGRQSL